MKSGASAPGKLILCGEYAVLEGAPGVVTAIDRRVHAHWVTSDSSTAPGREAQSARALAEQTLGTVPCALRLDATGLRHDGRKLGLGSSAASAAATAAAVFCWHDQDVTSDTVRRQLFELALSGHQAIAPEGSGIDVAASTFGGVLRFVRAETEVSLAPLEWPQGLHVGVVWTGVPVRTSDLVASVRRFAASDPRGFRSCLDRLKGGAEQFVDAFSSGVVRDIVNATAEYGKSMRNLGEDARVPIVDQRLETITYEAARLGGAAKPSGAGGGDVAVAFFDDAGRKSEFERHCRERGFSPLTLAFAAQGVEPLPPNA